MEKNQDYYRNKLKKRFQKQNAAAKEIGISSVHLNYFIKDKKDLGPSSLEKVIAWLEN